MVTGVPEPRKSRSVASGGSAAATFAAWTNAPESLRIGPQWASAFSACYGSGMPTYIDQSLKTLREFEGSVPWMYLDTVGRVTVGVGLMLLNELAAHSLPFVAGDQPATPDEISREFARVSAMKKGQLPHFYLSKGGLELPETAIEAKLRGALMGFEGYLRQHVKGSDGLPDAAKLALLDMVYNLGPGKLFAEYPRMLAAIEQGDWKTAAAHSQRRGPAPSRNAWTRQMLLDAGASFNLNAEAAASSAGTAMALGLLSGLAAAAALAILTGDVHRLAERQRRRGVQQAD